MIATLNDIKEIILDNPNKELVKLAKENQKKLRMHMYGENLKDYIKIIEGFEEKGLRDLREKYAVSNRDLFARLGRKIDKVFSARGGSVYYNLSDSLNAIAMRLCMDVRNGLSARKFVETYWRPHFLDDPTGCLFMEIGDGNTYPTYKSTSIYHDFGPKGNQYDYLCFTVSKSEKVRAGLKPTDTIFRFIDDAKDYYIRVKDKTVIPITTHTYENYFGVVPAISNSDFADPINDGLLLSLFSDIIEMADLYLLNGSIAITHGFRHGFPKYWEYADDCGTCGGTGTHDNNDCKDCKGSGKNLMITPNRAKALRYPTDKETPIVTPDVAGYIEPSEVYHQMAKDDKSDLETYMELTVWGNSNRAKTTGPNMNQDGTKTATEIVGDMQPEVNRLYPITDAAEARIKFIIDHVIKLQLRNDYKGASVNLGRRYLLESVDELWKRYSDARTQDADESILDELYTEFIETKYNSDPNGMDIMLKVKDVIPFFHKTAEEIRGLSVMEEDYKAKVYAGEWLKTITDSLILTETVVDLRKLLIEYASKKTLVPINDPAKVNQN